MTSSSPRQKSTLQRRKRAMLWSLVVILSVAVVLPFSSYFLPTPEVIAAPNEEEGNPRSDYWRSVREGVSGYTAVQGQETGVLIENGAQNWRAVRNGPIANYGGWLLALAILGIGAFYLMKGQVKIEPGRSGQTIQRWSGPERLMHWYTASLFILLAITGLSILFGRVVLIPVIGKEAFAAYTLGAKVVHNYLGPFFLVGIILIIFSWYRYNFFNRTDIEWFKQGGGIVGNRHPDAGRMNGGEKVWFWIVCLCGLAVCISGLILDFPNFGQDRETMQIANVVHSVLSIIFISVSFGHIYIGTLGTEGALEGMVKGEVDVNWAKQHHNLWYQEVVRDPGSQGQPAAGRPTGVPRHSPSS